MKKTISIILSLLVYITNMSAQDSLQLEKNRNIDVSNMLDFENPRSLYRYGISSSVIFNGFLCWGYGLDYFITPNISAEINVGVLADRHMDHYYDIGFKYWFDNKYSKNRFSPFLGLAYQKHGFVFDGEIYDGVVMDIDSYAVVKVPFGAGYFGRNGFFTSIQFSVGDLLSFRLAYLEATLKVGWRFK
ncbi:MAG: hypothetical protein BWY08_01930 [Bacteroidetes bacterium ADurb.Bin174]|nr:MAG: hypothetical protein BWY08_01930 [Bacteroidetes bacterium ADurb.Bin174]